MAQPTTLAAEAATTSSIFHLFNSLPPELQLHVFHFVLDWLIAETRGRAPHCREDYTKIRQLLYEFGLNPLLRTNRLVRTLTLTAWKLKLLRLRNGGLKSERDERRIEKALCLIEFLCDTELRLDGIRLLLTSNARWEEIKAQLCIIQLTNAGEQSRKGLTSRLPLVRRLSAVSTAAEVWILTFAEHGNYCSTLGCGNNDNSCKNLRLKSYYHCRELSRSDLLLGYNAWGHRFGSSPFNRRRTAEEFESTWVGKVEDARLLDTHRGDVLASSALSRENIVVELKWRKEGWTHRAVAEELRKEVVRCFRTRLLTWPEEQERVVRIEKEQVDD